MGVSKIGRFGTIVTLAIVLLLLCSLNVTNGQQSGYSLVQRESLVLGPEEHGGQINSMLRGPNLLPGSPVSEEIRDNVGPASPIYPIGPAGPNPYPGPNPRSEIGQGEIRGNDVSPTTVNHNATKHVVIPLPPQRYDNNVVIGNRVIKSEPTIYENVRQPYVTTSQRAEQEAVTSIG